MAKYEANLHGNLNEILRETEKQIQSSLSASSEEQSDYRIGDTHVVIRAYERYSFLGGNRVSLTLIFTQYDNRIHATAITTGGSQAVLFKLNTFGEEAFLNQISKVLDRYR